MENNSVESMIERFLENKNNIMKEEIEKFTEDMKIVFETFEVVFR